MTSLIDNRDVVNKIKDTLIKREETIAVAESVTSGLLQASLSLAVDAMQFYQGGITTYNIGQKAMHLNVEPIHALKVNCVSENVATTMAINCSAMFNSMWAVGITGFASPVPESNNKLYAFYTIVYNDEIVCAEKITASKGEPFEVQLFYTECVLKDLLACINRQNKKT